MASIRGRNIWSITFYGEIWFSSWDVDSSNANSKCCLNVESKMYDWNRFNFGSIALLLHNTLKWSAILGLGFFARCWWPRESMIRCSSMLSEFFTSLSKVLTIWYCVKVKQCNQNVIFAQLFSVELLLNFLEGRASSIRSISYFMTDPPLGCSKSMYIECIFKVLLYLSTYSKVSWHVERQQYIVGTFFTIWCWLSPIHPFTYFRNPRELITSH